ncbi:unnamed protein product [Didymodactylos carnosus]|uniref:Tudor domain-containing protein n=1 Tax=Didymodactylos carnosus TaxID=1234261 RepID=A0A8S2CX94_9BILA|nr:unnamed protein product [Didymodactylos carnosus]CAF3527113.1 unnamed protein product [Didymodactylos carnosus]
MYFSARSQEIHRAKSLPSNQYDSGRSSKQSDSVLGATNTPSTSQHTNSIVDDDDCNHESENFDLEKTPVRVQNSLVISGTCHSGAYVSHIDHISAFFVQLPSSMNKFQTLHAQMNECYAQHAVNETISLKESDYCVAQYSKDNEFYRARVVTVEKNPKVRYEVIYIDFGNSEWLPTEKIRPMFREFSYLPVQAIVCTLSEVMPSNSGRPSWSSDEGKRAVEVFKNMVLNKSVDVTFLPKTNLWPLCFVKISTDEGQDMYTYLTSDLSGNILAKATKGNYDLFAEFNSLLQKRDYILYSIPYEGDGNDDHDSQTYQEDTFLKNLVEKASYNILHASVIEKKHDGTTIFCKNHFSKQFLFKLEQVYNN